MGATPALKLQDTEWICTVGRKTEWGLLTVPTAEYNSFLRTILLGEVYKVLSGLKVSDQ